MEQVNNYKKFSKTIIPPFRYSVVEVGLYRGAFPTERNYRFLKRLRLKTLISLIPKKKHTLELAQLCENENIQHKFFSIEKIKDVVEIPQDTIVNILETIIDKRNHPVFVHCLDGVRVTGVIIMCLRKLQLWNFSAIDEEYRRFCSRPGPRESEYVEQFDGNPKIPDDEIFLPTWLWHEHRRFEKNKIKKQKKKITIKHNKLKRINRHQNNLHSDLKNINNKNIKDINNDDDKIINNNKNNRNNNNDENNNKNIENYRKENSNRKNSNNQKKFNHERFALEDISITIDSLALEPLSFIYIKKKNKSKFN